MGIDYTSSALYGVELEAPEDCECDSEWFAELVEDAPDGVGYFTTGSSYCGNVKRAVGYGLEDDTRGGMADWGVLKVKPEDVEALVSWLKEKGIEGPCKILFGLHVW